MSDRLVDTSDALIGRTAGTYRIAARIGAGGMGEVYRADDLKLHRPVALKLLPQHLAADADRLWRFHAEAQAVSSLNHPHILVIHDFGEIDGRPFIATEFVEGETLRQRLERGALPLAETLGIVTQVASALAAAHARGMVHRDVKPENIMIRPDGYAKVLDFGLAKLTSSSAASEAVSMLSTEAGVVMGTPRYMSPEQTRGLAIDPRTDVWSLGVVLYEMIAGRPPFGGATPADVMVSILNTEPALLEIAAPQTPERLARIVSTALAKDAAGRYASARELHDALIECRQSVDSGVAHGPVAGSVARSASHTVGRTKERAELAGAFHRASSGQGHLLSVSGEPGSGKSTLVEEFLAGLTASGTRCRIGRGRCSERLAGAEAYLPVLDALENLLHASGDPEVARQMKATAPTWYAQISTATPGSGVAPAQAGSQERLKREVAALIRELSRAQPLVLFFDDLHWADASTIDLLTYLVPQFAGLRVLLVVTSRPSDLLLANHPFLSLRRDLQARRLAHEVSVEMLTRDDVARYLALEFPNHRFPSQLPDLIHGKTEGSPLFVADLVRDLSSNGTLVPDADGQWVVKGSLAAIGRDLPESVRGMIERKIAQLADADRALLTAASVQGYEFDSAVVAQALSLDPLEVEERLEVLERVHRFVQFMEERECPDRTMTLRYRFVHVLYQNALYAQLRATRRTTLSATVAETLLRLHGARHPEIASELAILFEAARDFARAAEYCRLAAQRASHLFASQEAVVLARRGVALLQSVPESRERQERELALLVSLGNALIATRGYAAGEVLETYTRAHELCQRVGETPYLSAVLYGFAALHLVRGNHPTALRYGTELLALTERQQDPAVVVGHRLVGWPLLAMGRLAEARTHFEATRAIYDAALHRPLAYSYGHEPGSSAQINLAITLWLLGEADEAQQCRNEALELGRQTPHANSQCYVLHFAAIYDQLRGDAAAARANADAGLKVAEEQQLALWLRWTPVLRGWAAAAGGDLAGGATEMRRAIDAARAVGAEVFHTYDLGLLAETLCQAGRYDEALTTLDEADRLVEATEERFWESELLRVRSAVARQRGDREGAAEYLTRAIAVAQRQGARSLEQRSEAARLEFGL
jgi:predicted ATPase